VLAAITMRRLDACAWAEILALKAQNAKIMKMQTGMLEGRITFLLINLNCARFRNFPEDV
jgi:hypothetical protein